MSKQDEWNAAETNQKCGASHGVATKAAEIKELMNLRHHIHEMGNADGRDKRY